jgi:PIN domain nuclease of toxin-antitoxin system
MRLLVDTHAFLWWISDSPELSRRARSAIASRANECYVSLASCWEMAVKTSLGKLELRASLDRFMAEQLAANGFRELAIDLKHVGRVASLPFHHRDPFDRLLAAQALEEALSVVSRDAIFRRYGVRRIW